MARIPTISAQSITGLPGTAGGVKLTRTGVGAVPISTPLTQRLNPAAFGQVGAAVAELGQTIFNEVALPALERRQKNARAKQSLDESDRLYKEMSAIKLELGKNTPPAGWEYLTKYGGDEDIAWEKHFEGINNKIDNLYPSINANVSDKTHAVALSNAFLPQIAALKLKAQNRQVKVSDNRAISSYKESQKTIVGEIMSYKATRIEGGEEAYAFKGKKIEEALLRLELINNVFANSGVDPLDRQKVIAAAHKVLVDEVTGSLQTDPRMGQVFLAKYGEDLGMTRGEIGEAIYKLHRFAAQHTKWKNDLSDAAETKMENTAQALLNAPVQLDDGSQVPQLTKLKLQAIAGELNRPDFYKAWGDTFDRANQNTAFNFINDLIKPTDTAAGETKPSVYSNFKDEVTLALGNREISNDEIDVLENKIIAAKNDISKADQMALIKTLSTLKQLSTKNPRYMAAEDLLAKQAPVPVDKYDTGAAAQRSRAIWDTWLTDINTLTEKNDPAAWRKHDFFGRAKEIIRTHSKIWDQPSSEGSQILYNEYARKFARIFGNDNFKISVSPSKDSNLMYLDVDLMIGILRQEQDRKTMSVDQVKDALAIIRAVENAPGLTAKVADVRNTKAQEELQLQQQEKTRLEEQKKKQDLYQLITPDVIEDFIRKNKPDLAKEYFGTAPEVTPKPVVKEQPGKVSQEQPFFGDVMGAIDQGMVNSKEFFAAWQQGYVDPSNNFDDVLKGITKYRDAQAQDKGPKKDPQQGELFKDEAEPDIWMQDYKRHNAAGEKVLADLTKRGGSEVWINVARSLLADLKSAAKSKNDEEFDAVWGNFKQVAKKIQDGLPANE